MLHKIEQLLLKMPRWVWSGVYFALICYLTLVPKPLPDTGIRFWKHTDKVVHALMFGAMYVCLYLDIWRGGKPQAWRRWLLTLPVAAFGALIEVLQQAMAMGRGGDVFDFLADSVGIFLAALVTFSL